MGSLGVMGMNFELRVHYRRIYQHISRMNWHREKCRARGSGLVV